MAFKHKLSARLALMRDRALVVSVSLLLGCEAGGTNDPAATLTSIVVIPDSMSLAAGQPKTFLAYGRNALGDSVDVGGLGWTSSGGTITSGGVFLADSAGNYTVTAKTNLGSFSAGSRVQVYWAVASVAVGPTAPTAVPGQTIQLTATPEGSGGTPLMGSPVTWATSSASVATVSSSGLVTAVAPGAASITATSGGQSGTASLTVALAPVASVVVSPATASVSVGQTAQLTATPEDANGNALTGRAVTWATSNASVATVSGSGLVTVIAAGTATITATSGGQSGTASITATTIAVASVVVSPTTANVTAGQTTQLTATPKDASGNPLTGRVVTWATSNAAVATVSASGLATGIGAGAATITATSEGQSGTALVTVTGVPVASVVVSPTTSSVTVGQTAQLTATPEDANGNALTGRAVTWATSNGAVATVSGSGLVTGILTGTATITATSGGQSGTASLTVTAVPVASVVVSPTTSSVTAGETTQLSATPEAANGSPLTGRVVTWTTSSATVATVSSSGLVTAVGTGSATITATCGGQSATATVTVTSTATGPWPNDPYSQSASGWYLITDYGFTDPLPDGSVAGQMLGASYWYNDQGASITGGGMVKVYDPTAPNSGMVGWSDSVLQFTYPNGYVAGVAPATLYFTGPTSGANQWYSAGGTSQTYMGFWFKYSSNWYGEQSCVNKMTEFMDNQDVGSYFYEACGVGTNTLTAQSVTETPGIAASADYDDNRDATSITRNAWHLGEILWTYTGTHTGRLQRWLDGTLQVDTTVALAGTGFSTAQIYPDWGGGGDILTTGTQQFYIAHVRITGHP